MSYEVTTAGLPNWLPTNDFRWFTPAQYRPPVLQQRWHVLGYVEGVSLPSASEWRDVPMVLWVDGQ